MLLHVQLYVGVRTLQSVVQFYMDRRTRTVLISSTKAAQQRLSCMCSVPRKTIVWQCARHSYIATNVRTIRRLDKFEDKLH